MSAARPKRHAEAHGRYASPDSKKPRFDYRNPSTLAPDAPEEDAILELDEIGKGGQQIKRNAVNLDGYESDSSNEGLDARPARKGVTGENGNGNGNGAASKDEEDMDMFADMEDVAGGAGVGGEGDDEERAAEGKAGKKSVRFMDINDIEGQVQSSKSGGHVAADFSTSSKGKAPAPLDDGDAESSSESGSDTERDRIVDTDNPDASELGAGSKKKHAPKLDAFNMQQEGEEGRFDEAGNYIRKAADPDAVHDSWLMGLSKKDMKKAREAAEKREAERRAKTAADDALLTSDLLSSLIAHLGVGETALEALQRLQAQAKKKPKEKKIPKWKRKKENPSADDMHIDTEPPPPPPPKTTEEDPAELTRRAHVDAITAAADALFSRQQPDIYELEREVLMRQYRRETGEDWTPPADQIPVNGDGAGAGTDAAQTEQQQEKQYEYRWADGRDGVPAHGPYDAPTMRAWTDAGYFGAGVEFRHVGAGDAAWSAAVEFR